MKPLLLLGIVFCAGGVTSQLMAVAVDYRARMRRQCDRPKADCACIENGGTY